MNYWWVNQGGTHVVEHAGAYMWSPLREVNGARNQAYENMKAVAPGDLIFSHFKAHIGAIGTAFSYSYAAPRPDEFPDEQNKGIREGWQVNVQYRTDIKRFSPKAHLAELMPLLPAKYSPLQSNGIAAMKLYLVQLSPPLADKLMELIGITAADFPSVTNLDTPDAQHLNTATDAAEIKKIEQDNSPRETEKVDLVNARRGQGLFRQRVCKLERRCRISGISNPSFLIASHIKPWHASSNAERLDGENGLLLSPNTDRLFDRNFISFDDAGTVLVSPLLTPEERAQFGLDKVINAGTFTAGQKRYLAHHRERLKKNSG